ncbi:spinocerebellar ataxia type 10 protein domain-containing protein [Limtongia smithiae]|uniref:spinocerebellar ataxia type 10 protein domain-containing protein n=1 Tax=Limtongia smithiae TaxID=1125753 RepID=UPI0034CE7BAC
MKLTHYCKRLSKIVTSGNDTSSPTPRVRDCSLSPRQELGRSEGSWAALHSILHSFHKLSGELAANGEQWKRVTTILRTTLSFVMNLLATGSGAQAHAYEYVFDDILRILESPSVVSELLTTSCFRILINLTAANESLKAVVFTEFLEYYNTRLPLLRDILDRAQQDEPGISATLIFVVGSISTSSVRGKLLLDSRSGRMLLNDMLDMADTWFHESIKATDTYTSTPFDLSYSIIESLILHSLLPTAFDVCGAPDVVPCERQLVLIKFLEAFLDRPSTQTSTIKSSVLIELSNFLYTTLFMSLCKPLTVQCMTKKIANDAFTTRMSDFTNVVLKCIMPLVLMSKDIREVFIQFGAVTELVDLLAQADRLVPRRTLKSVDTDMAEDDIQSFEFPNMKMRIVSILTILIEKNAYAQDQVRHCGGLSTILTQCNIDDNNPFIREFSILCIKNLLDNNPENQAFVASLEAREAVSSDALLEAGYETEIIDGKIALKQLQPR